MEGGEIHGEAVRGVMAGLIYQERASRGNLLSELIETFLCGSVRLG